MEELCISPKQGTMLRNFSLLQLEDNAFQQNINIFPDVNLNDDISYCLKTANL